MEAGMGTTARGRNNAGSKDHMRGIASTAFIDVNYETPINSNNIQQQQQHQQQQQPMMGYPPQSNVNNFRSYPPNQQGVYPQPSQGYNPQMMNNSQMFMNPQMNMSINNGFNSQQPMMYINPSSSSIASVAKSTKPKSRQRRNSNSSISTISVNKFMKKQWNKIGGGDGYEDDGDGDGKTELEEGQNEISFDDLQHIRGDRPGFGLTDSTPYIPTLKVNMSANGSKVTGEQYRKIQMAQKKAMAMNYARQNKQQSQQPGPHQNQMMMNPGMIPPRAMSLQSYGGGYSPFNQMIPQQIPHQMSQQMSQQNGRVMAPQNGVIPMPMSIPRQQQQQHGMMVGVNPYMTGGNPSNPSFNPRSMSLQSESAMNQRNFQTNVGVNPSSNWNSGTQSRIPSNNNYQSRTLPSQPPNEQESLPNKILENVSENNIQSDFHSDRKSSMKAKTVNKIDFSPVTAEDNDDDVNGIAEQLQDNNRSNNDASPINEDLLPTSLPKNNSSVKPESSTISNTVRRPDQHKISRSVVDSIVSFDSVTQKEQKNKQEKLYHIRNNSSQKTIFYSASEFQANGSLDNIPKSSNDESKQKLAIHEEAIDEEEPVPEQPININAISDSLDKLVLNASPNLNNNSFANNYGSYGNDIRKSDLSSKSAESTQPLHIGIQNFQDPIKENDIETSSPIKNVSSNSKISLPLSPAKTEDSKNNYVDMTISLKSQSKESSPSKSLSTNTKKEILGEQHEDIVYKRKFTPPSSAIALIGAEPLTAATSVKSSPNKVRSIDSDPRTPISLNSLGRYSFFTPEQCGLLNDNTQLLQELELVTTELASSVSREIALEADLRKSSRVLSKDNFSMKKASSNDGVNDDTITDDIDGKSISQYVSRITSLTKQLNEERKRRYLVEEMLLKLQESSSTAEIETELLEQKTKVGELTDELNNITENVKLHQTEKDLLTTENNTLKLKVEELENNYGYLELSVVPRLKNQVEILEDMLQNSKTTNVSL